MKRLFIISLSVIICMTTHSQVLINLQLPPSGIMVKTQLWNFSLVNTTSTEMNVQVEMMVTDVSNNQRVLTGTSKVFVLPKGIKQVQANDVTPVIYNVNNSNYGIDASPDGFLPVGVFAICFNVVQLVSDATDRLAEECETIEIEPLSPPILILPADSEHVDISRPFFTWIPPAPFTLFNNLQYDWVLAEVQLTQTGAVAVQQNMPVLTMSNIATTGFQYPLSSPELDTGKLYAWQVTAKNNNTAVGKSEVFTFRVAKPAPEGVAYRKAGYYVMLKKENEPTYAVCEGVVRYRYLNELNDSLANIKIFDINSAKPVEVFPDSARAALKFGQNYMSINLEPVSGVINKHIYLFELTNSKNEKWYMKFEYRQPVQ